MAKIGIMHSGAGGKHDTHIDAFKKGLYLAGYDESIILNNGNPFWADDDSGKLRKHAKNLVSQNVNVIVAAGGTASATAAMNETSTIPIVFTSRADMTGLAANMTGVCARTSELDPKRLDLLNQLMGAPAGLKISVLASAERLTNNPTIWPQLQNNNPNNVILSLESVAVPQNSTQAQIDNIIGQAVANCAAAGAQAVLVTADPLFNNHRKAVISAVNAKNIPAIYQWREFAEDDGLMSYGTNLTQAYALAGILVGKILDTPGAPLPQRITLPNSELIINLKSAKNLKSSHPHFVIPDNLLTSANELIV